jgi:glycine/D-amino acid oxidase-like deaminating enzyme
LPPAERHAFLNTVRTPSYPRKVVWEKLFRNAEREGRLVYVGGEVAEIEVGSGDVRVRIKGRGVVPAQRVVLATGFEVDARKHALVEALCTRYGFAVEQGRIIADNNFTITGVGTPHPP